jgi:hypothetical protein
MLLGTFRVAVVSTTQEAPGRLSSVDPPSGAKVVVPVTGHEMLCEKAPAENASAKKQAAIARIAK